MSINGNQCTQCYVGRYRDVDMPYICWLDDRKVVVPGVPGFKCDICGDSYYKPAYIQHLHRLIDRIAVSSHPNSTAQRGVATGGLEGGKTIGRSAKS